RMTTALVVMLHGSPYASSNEPALHVIEDIRRRRVYDQVVVGFLECNEPCILDAIRECVEMGAQRVVALPFFLHLGTHVVSDIPEILSQACSLWPDVEFRLAPPLGRAPSLAVILAERAKAALLPRQVEG
ncbi:MAG: CbiX/SirB N-terminal domain-containing protein, partial [Candidatus Sumerlaeaceae bacterium]|nr:CbiX/SirB N-terminal domain-containing protein [Candidatus Sumerlaeaceae bacterium]